MSFDLSMIAIVFALLLLIVFFSAVVLYLSFRVKETFKKETRRGATIVKVGFLIGVLFLGGGMFYFFANSLAIINQPTSTPTISAPPTTTPTTMPSTSPITSSTPQATPTQSSLPTPSPQSSPTPTSSTSSPSATTTPFPTPTSGMQALSLTVSYPPTVKMNSQITMSFTIINPTGTAVHSATIQTNTLLQEFTLQQSTSPVVGNVINIGDLPAGQTIISLQLLSPSRPREITDSISLVYQEMPSALTQQITITVRGN